MLIELLLYSTRAEYPKKRKKTPFKKKFLNKMVKN